MLLAPVTQWLAKQRTHSDGCFLWAVLLACLQVKPAGRGGVSKADAKQLTATDSVMVPFDQERKLTS